MAKYTGKQREYYNIRRQLETRLKAFQKANIEPPAPLRAEIIRKIMETTPGRADALTMRRARALKEQFRTHKFTWTPAGQIKQREQLMHRLTASPEEGGLGYTNITEENKALFFEFMEYVRSKFESMMYDSDIYAAAANEMLGAAKKRNVSPEEIKKHFERFAEQAIRITGSNRKTLDNYQRNFNALARRLGL